MISRSDSLDPEIRHNLAKWISALSVLLAIQHATGHELVSYFVFHGQTSLPRSILLVGVPFKRGD